MKLWIVRDERGFCYVSKAEPFNYEGEWLCDYGMLFIGGVDDFSEVTFENSPQQVEIKLIK